MNSPGQTTSPRLLSVCMPTYNRAPLLRETVARLLPQLTEACELIVIDNCSDTDVATALADLVAGYPHLRIRILRNEVNIGAGPNILRCFEYAAGDWVWVLGDTDAPTPRAIESILAHIAFGPDLVYLNFDTTVMELYTKPTVRKQDFQTEGLDGFVRGMDNFSNVLFLSAGLYRRKAVLPHLRHAYSFVDTLAAHLALLLLTLRQGGRVKFCRQRTVDWKYEGVESWNYKVVTLKLARLLELIPPGELRTIWLREYSYPFPAPLGNLKAILRFAWPERGTVAALREVLTFRAYLGHMVPGYRSGNFWIGLATLLAWLARPLYRVLRWLRARLQGRAPKQLTPTSHANVTETFLKDPRL